MFDEIKQTLRDFRCRFDVYFHENDLHESGATDRALARLRELGNIYEADGAVWLRTEKFGDDKDRVIVKSDGHGAYISGDVAYYLDKRERGFDRCIILLGADHHGYVGRMMALCAAFGDEPGVNLEIIIGQMVNLLSHGAVVGWASAPATSSRSLDLVEAIGVDAARYALVRNSLETNLDIDLDLLDQGHQRQPGLLRAVRPRPGLLDPAQRRRARPRARLAPRAAHPREGGRAAARARRVPARRDAPRPTLREPHRVARYLEDTAASYHRFYDSCRVLPMGDEEPVRPAPRPAPARRGDADRAGQRAGPARGLRPRADVTAAAMPTHEAGWAHADGALRGPSWLREPRDPNALVAGLWSTTSAQGRRRAWSSAGCRCPTSSPTSAPRRTSSTRPTSAPAPGPSARRSPASDVFYAGKAFLCTTVARWVAEEGLGLDVCTGGELAVALRAGFARPASASTATTRPSPSCAAPSPRASAGSSSTRSTRSTGSAVTARACGARPAGAGPRDGRRRGPHPRVHRDRPRGPEVRLLARRRRRPRGGRRVVAAPGLELLGLHSHIGSQIFDTSGFEVAAHRVVALHAEVGCRGRRRRCPSSTSAAASASPTRPRTTRPTRHSRDRAARDRRARVPRARPARAAALGRAGPRDRRAGDVHALRGRHGQAGRARRGRGRTYVCVDGGMSDNIRTALYDADYTCALASRGLATRRRCSPASSASTASPATSSSRTRGCPPTSRPGDLLAVAATGAYCRSMASNYNHVLRPPGGRGAAGVAHDESLRAGDGRRPARPPDRCGR